MATTNEHSPLLRGGEDSNESFLRHHQVRLQQNVSKDRADIVLLFLHFDTGLVDGSAISTWNAFVSMQTGNTIYFGLGLVEPSSSNRWLKALISIILFMFGSMCFSTFHRWYGSPTRRWVLTASFAFQSLCILAAAIMVTAGIIDSETMHWSNVLSIGLLSFQSSGQAIASQVLQYSKLPTVVLTSVYRDLMSDPALFAPKPSANPKRNRRVLAVLMCVAGAAVSRLIGMSPAGLAGSLWFSAGIKAIVALTWLVWSPEKESEQ